jgi:hypothetical protein
VPSSRSSRKRARSRSPPQRPPRRDHTLLSVRHGFAHALGATTTRVVWSSKHVINHRLLETSYDFRDQEVLVASQSWTVGPGGRENMMVISSKEDERAP